MTERKMKSYLGDGVYADFDGYHIVLTTEDGIATTNTIYLEPPVMRSLRLFEEQVDEFMRKGDV